MSGLTDAARATSSLELRPLTPSFGYEVLGVQAGAVDDALFEDVYAAFLAGQMLLFRDQDLSPGGQVAFARRFGDVQIHVMDQYRRAAHPELYYLTNLGGDGKPNGKHPDKGTLAWHTDGSWKERTGQATLLFAETTPRRGGGTGFADMYGAHDALSAEERARLEGRRAVHNLDFSRNRRHGEDPMTEAQKAEVPPVAHPILRVHPETGRPALFLGDHAEYVEGMDYAAGRTLIDGLNARAVAATGVYRHRWRPRDLMVWDNRCLLHKAEAYDVASEPRVIRRCTILGKERIL